MNDELERIWKEAIVQFNGWPVSGSRFQAGTSSPESEAGVLTTRPQPFMKQLIVDSEL
jgi:hypothetical protein